MVSDESKLKMNNEPNSSFFGHRMKFSKKKISRLGECLNHQREAIPPTEVDGLPPTIRY